MMAPMRRRLLVVLLLAASATVSAAPLANTDRITRADGHGDDETALARISSTMATMSSTAMMRRVRGRRIGWRGSSAARRSR